MPEQPEKRHGEESARRVEALKEQIDAVAQMSKAVRVEPDLSSIWAGQEFEALSEQERRALKDWARERGLPAPVEHGDIESTVAGLRENAATIVRMSEAMNTEPDLGIVWHDPRFLSLPEDARRRLREEFGAEDKETSENGDTAAPVPERPEATEHAPRKERERRPVRRKFEGYRVERSDDGPLVVEDFEEWDDDLDAYARKHVKTGIIAPPDAAKDEEAARDFADAASSLRRELDRRGVKMFFDRPKDDPERIKPKWKYVLHGKTEEDLLRDEDVPDDIMALVRRSDKYYRTPEWRKWFGREMQHKREEIISKALGTADTPEVKREVAPTPAAPGSVEAVDDGATEPRERPKEVDITQGLGMLVEKFAPLYRIPEDVGDLVRHVTQFAGSLFRYRRRRAGLPVEGEASAEERSMVRRALLEHFKDDPTAAAAVLDAFVAERHAEEERTEKDPMDTRIRAASTAGLEDIIAELERSAEAGDQGSREEARRQLMDIEFGRAGKASEERVEGLDRDDAERRFFDAHAALDRRNIETLPDGRLIVHVDKKRPTEAIRRAMKAVLEDAEDGDLDEEAAKEACVYFERLVSGAREASEDAVRAFRGKIADFDPGTAELTVTDLDRLSAMMRSAYERIVTERRRTKKR